MNLDHDSKFARRHNGDGSVDSICLICFQTAATAKSESQLSELETQHECGSNIITARTALSETLRFRSGDKKSAQMDDLADRQIDCKVIAS